MIREEGGKPSVYDKQLLRKDGKKLLMVFIEEGAELEVMKLMEKLQMDFLDQYEG